MKISLYQSLLIFPRLTGYIFPNISTSYFDRFLSIKIGHKLSRSIFELFLNEVLIERYGHYLLSARLSWVLVFMAVLTFPQAVTLARGPVTQAGGNQHQYHFNGLRLALSTFICQIHRGWSITAFVTRFHLFSRALSVLSFGHFIISL